MKNKFLSLALFFVLGNSAFAAQDNEWQIDTRHSSAIFSIKHMMVSNVNGQISGITGSAKYDGKNVDSIAIKVDLDPATINTSDPDRDKHLRSADFFDVEKYPKMTFESTGVMPILEGGFKLGGKLTIHGITKDVELTVDGPTQPIKDKKGNIKIGATGTTTIKRKDFGISYDKTLDNGGLMVGDEVRITLDVELVKKAEEPKKASIDNVADTK